MDYTHILEKNNQIQVKGIQRFSLPEILECGQAFRWYPSEENRYQGIAYGTYLEIEQKEDTLLFHNTTRHAFDTIWKGYFDLDRDYGEVQAYLSQNPTLRKAIAHAPGIRVLAQEPWETLCTFIFSQNNNIKRIQGLVDRFAREFGTQIGENQFAFPTVQQIASLSLEQLQPVRAGFRAKYILDAAQKVAQGTVSLTAPYELPLEEAGEHLKQIFGVGPKVSDCVLLFGFGRLESFPLDVWMLRVVDTFYPKGFPKKYQKYAGLAQQYLFHYARQNPALVSGV